jgi:hypothetical protein
MEKRRRKKIKSTFRTNSFPTFSETSFRFASIKRRLKEMRVNEEKEKEKTRSEERRKEGKKKNVSRILNQKSTMLKQLTFFHLRSNLMDNLGRLE